MKFSSEQVREATAPIVLCVEALAERERALGAHAAFDPDDPQTSAFFRGLWQVSFEQQHSPDMQDAIIAELETRHPAQLRSMRSLGNRSEIEMEKSFGKHAIERAEAAINARVGQRPRLMTRIGRARANLQEARSDGDARMIAFAHEQLSEVINDTIWDIHQLCRDFPYHTYPQLVHGENLMLTALQGLDFNRQQRGTHLVIEAGALPFTAIFSSLQRLDGKVVATIGDKQSFEIAKRFVNQLEELQLIEEGVVELVNIPPTGEALAGLELNNIYAATITQLVPGQKAISDIVHSLSKRGIDTVVARGANGMNRILYEPLDDIRLPQGMCPRFNSVPPNTQASDWQHSHTDDTARHSRLCYNTSHVFSKRLPIARSLPSEMRHFFQPAGEQAYRA